MFIKEMVAFLAFLSVLPFVLAQTSGNEDRGMAGVSVMNSRRSSNLRSGEFFFNSHRNVALPRPMRVGVGNAPVVFANFNPTRSVPAPNFNPVVVEENNEDYNDYHFGDADMNDTMELPAAMDISEMDATSSTMEMMSSLQSMGDFSRMFGIDMPEEDNSMDSDSSNFAARFGGSRAVELTSAVCTPENKTVILDLPRELNIVYFPRCVRLMRCGGCCHGPLLTCQQTKTSPIKLKILKVSLKSSSSDSVRIRDKPVSSGRSRSRTRSRSRRRNRRQETASYHEVLEYHHTACGCQCRIQESDCDPLIQIYNQDECLCRCKNEDEQHKCNSQDGTHYWDIKSCQCFCHKEEVCNTGQRFDHVSCSCIKLPSYFLRNGINGRSAGVSGIDVLEELPVGAVGNAPVIFN